MRTAPGLSIRYGGEGTAPPPRPGEVQLWSVPLDRLAGEEEVARTLLVPGERERALRFRFDRDRRLFMLGRMMLRRILGATLGISPADVPLHAGRHGKPELVPRSDGPIVHFNLSHSDGLALYAVSREGPIGVDVERIRPMDDLDGVAALVMSPRERAAFTGLDDAERLAFFHAAWTRKEAYLKAIGDGLMRSPALIEFGALLGERETIRDLEAADVDRRWRIAAWQADGYCSALVAASSVDTIIRIAIAV